jgi:thiosulfate/3-mercaptopyruvate sulfurtransferase
MLSVTCALALVLPEFADVEKGGKAYPRPDLLIEAADLLKPEAAHKFIVLDARGKDKYQEGHVPGAVWVDVITWARQFGEGKDREGWSKRIGALGIDRDARVVLYDDNLAKDAARVWWILRYWGVEDVRLLNGGWTAWKAVGGTVDKQETKPKSVEAKLSPRGERLATKSQLLEALKGKPPQILDARSTGEYCGTEETAKRNGSIPGAKHLEWSDVLDKKTGRFKSQEDLTRLFKEAGIDPSQPATTYCQSGGRAAVLAFVVELMGGKEVRNYYRSWAEWGNDPDTPIVKPQPKK